ncbi:MAG: iron ABC transporter permease [Bacillota bacterium]|nr:iron ABC transporter permease [Bacillota bacterium]
MKLKNKTDKKFVMTGSFLPVFAMLLLFLFLLYVSTLLGSAKIDLSALVREFLSGEHSEKFQSNFYIITQVRLPRIVLCAITGMTLGLSGCIMQSVLRNPLASPFTLGVSSGASFGAAVAMVLGASVVNTNFLFKGYSVVAVNAFFFGTLSLFLVYQIARFSRNDSTVLILSGVAVSSMFSAGVSILKYISSAEALKNLDTWLMGGFWRSNWNAVLTVVPFFVLSLVIIIRFSWDLNVLNAGEDVAATLGVNVKVLKRLLMLTVSLAASVSIAFSGIIGFVGLVSPHISRSLVGVDNRRLIFASALMGGILLLLSDTVARTVIQPKEMPVGIITSIIGVPFFIGILIRRRKQMWG